MKLSNIVLSEFNVKCSMYCVSGHFSFVFDAIHVV